MIRVNLLKPEQKDIREPSAAPSPAAEVIERKRRPKSALIFLALIVAIFAFYYFQDKNLKREQGILNSVLDEKQQYKDVETLLNQVEQQRRLLENKINLINTLKSHQHVAVNIMEELSINIPDWVWLVETSYDQNEIRIKGKALSNTLVADYMYNLENSPSFTAVNLISSTQSGGNEYLEFSLTARYVLPPALAGPNQGRVNEEKK